MSNFITNGGFELFVLAESLTTVNDKRTAAHTSFFIMDYFPFGVLFDVSHVLRNFATKILEGKTKQNFSSRTS